MKINLPEDVRGAVENFVRRFGEKGFECYLVGGSVRDLILGNEIVDYDFATNALPAQVMELFHKVIPTGIKHGTVSVLLGQHTFEITTYRSDGKYLDGRHPDTITFSKTLEEDVKRRDFTINGLAYDPVSTEIIDHSGGLGDIEKKIIRTIGNPLERFSEDGLRSVRACRFAAKLNFEIEQDTFDAIGKTLHITEKVSAERIRDELMKLFETDRPSVGIEHLRISGLLNLILPELAQCHSLLQNRYHKFDIYYHSIYSCDSAPGNYPLLRLAALLHDVGKAATRRQGSDGDYTFYNHEVIGGKIVKRIMKRLKFSNEDTDHVSNLIFNHMFHYTDEWTDGAVRRFMRKIGMENLDDLILLRLADRKGNGVREGMPGPIRKLRSRITKIIEQENAFSVKDLDIDGHDLMAGLGISPGPVIGTILNELLEMVLDSPENNKKDILLAKARELYTILQK